MINNKTILAIIPARGGSKRLPGKNIMPLGGKPLIHWTIEAALASSYVDRVIVSSDEDEILETTRRLGESIPLPRPAELAQDETPTMPVLHHVIDTIGDIYDYILLLQPTSPLRTAADIDNMIETGLAKKADYIVSINEETRALNGAMYLATAQWIRTHDTFVPDDTALLYPMPAEGSVDIDTMDEFEVCRIYLKNKS